MYISEIYIENFRSFGSGKQAFQLSLNPGLTALVGENDAGKTAVIDALRYVLGTRDQELLRVDETDFHQPPEGGQADQITIRLKFQDLTKADRGAFAEFLTFEDIAEQRHVCLVLTWSVKRTTSNTSRRVMSPEWRTGANGDGPLLDFGARSLLTATYLRPLRDAERAMSAGRGSRLSQILQHSKRQFLPLLVIWTSAPKNDYYVNLGNFRWSIPQKIQASKPGRHSAWNGHKVACRKKSFVNSAASTTRPS